MIRTDAYDSFLSLRLPDDADRGRIEVLSSLVDATPSGIAPSDFENAGLIFSEWRGGYDEQKYAGIRGEITS